MDRTAFWNLIERTRKKSGGEQDRQMDALREELEALAPVEIVDFQTHFDTLRAESYDWDLWGAAFSIRGGCSDDGFIDFRSWLISQGRAVFEAAVADVQSLAEVANPDEDDCTFEEFAYVAADVYEGKTGRDEIPSKAEPESDDPSGEPWEEEELPKRFPKLWSKYAGA
jgi:hypothetical protein